MTQSLTTFGDQSAVSNNVHSGGGEMVVGVLS